jgi:N6-adenosine-specific RNA methylase IME4
VTIKDVDALEVISDSNIQIGKFRLARTGLVVSGDPTYAEWYQCGKFLTQAEKAIQFWIGDWINYGEKKYGETYAQAIDATGMDYQTLANAKWVAGKVEPSLRRENLTFHHHKEIAALEPDAQEQMLDDAEKMHLNVRDFRDHVRQYKQAIEPANALPTSRHSVIYADPPWQYDFSKSDSREIENQYPTMPVDDICALPIPGIAAADCVLFMWATSPKLPEAMQVLNAWGFTYKTCMVWVKDKIGMGYYARQKHELLLIATQGNLPTPDPSNRPASVIEAPRGEHSRKPEVVYELLEKMYPNLNKIELFSRTPRAGWKAWGNQA